MLADVEGHSEPFHLSDGDAMSRAILKRLLPGKVTVTPTEAGWRYEGEANLIGHLAGCSTVHSGERAG